MAYGWQINDSSGTTIVDSTMSTGIIIGSVEITSGNQSGSLTNSDFQYGTPFWFLLPKASGPDAVPGVSFSGSPTDTMTWTAAPATFLGRIWYGIW